MGVACNSKGVFAVCIQIQIFFPMNLLVVAHRRTILWEVAPTIQLGYVNYDISSSNIESFKM